MAKNWKHDDIIILRSHPSVKSVHSTDLDNYRVVFNDDTWMIARTSRELRLIASVLYHVLPVKIEL